MIIKQIYQCEYCGKEWEIKENCLACESRHHNNLSITKKYYDSGANYPVYIVVTNNDNKEKVRYKIDKYLTETKNDA